MKKKTTNARTRIVPSALLLILPGLAACGSDSTAPQSARDVEADPMFASVSSQGIPVAGSAVSYASTAIVHTEVPTEEGMIQRSTAVARLSGDLDGWVLFHPTSVFDFAGGTLVNTGVQIFAGTVLGSDPVILHDDMFRFDIDLVAGSTTGEVHFSRSGDAENGSGWFECHLDVVGTGATPEGDPTSDYTGTCIRRGNPMS